MKKLIVEILVIMTLWLGGFYLSKYSHEILGFAVFGAGTLLALAYMIVGIFRLLDGPPEMKRIYGLAGFLILLLAFVYLRGNLEPGMNFRYVQNIENRDIAREVEEILTNPAKVQALKDYLEGKEIRYDIVWFVGEPTVAKRVAIQRILGTSAKETEVILDICSHANRVGYYALYPQDLEELKAKKIVQMAEKN